MVATKNRCLIDYGLSKGNMAFIFYFRGKPTHSWVVSNKLIWHDESRSGMDPQDTNNERVSRRMSHES